MAKCPNLSEFTLALQQRAINIKIKKTIYLLFCRDGVHFCTVFCHQMDLFRILFEHGFKFSFTFDEIISYTLRFLFPQTFKITLKCWNEANEQWDWSRQHPEVKLILEAQCKSAVIWSLVTANRVQTLHALRFSKSRQWHPLGSSHNSITRSFNYNTCVKWRCIYSSL